MMILQLKSDGRCSGDYADELWPRSDHLCAGQEGLVTALKKTEAYLASLHLPPAAVGLKAWLSRKAVKKVHRVELKRRKLPVSGKKEELSQRIFAHVASLRLEGLEGYGSYVDDTGVSRAAAPEGYTGDLPVAGEDAPVDGGDVPVAMEDAAADGAGSDDPEL